MLSLTFFLLSYHSNAFLRKSMANNYKGIFFGLDNKKYQVDIIGNPESNEYVLFELAAQSPFVVSYSASDTPFDPVRTSTAQINIVHNDYMEDILSAEAQGTRIQLADITDYDLKDELGNKKQYIDIADINLADVKWTGFLTPKIYDAPYRDEYETYQLEAADCISSLQYIDYTLMNEGGLVGFDEILSQICNACKNLEGFYWTLSKNVGSSALTPDIVSIVEHNFLYSDTKEPVKLSEVLEETCRYFGFTALQWGTRMYLVDYQYFHSNNKLYCKYYNKNGEPLSNIYLDSHFTVSEDTYRASDATISFEPVYNKVEVRDSFYTVEEYLPNIFDDAYLTNRQGDFYKALVVEPLESRGRWPRGLGYNYEDKKKRDTNYVYRHRYYDHKYWESIYSNIDTGVEYTDLDTKVLGTYITSGYRGGTIVDMGVVNKEGKNAGQQWVVPSKIDYTRYLCIRTGYQNDDPKIGQGQRVFRLKQPYSGSFVGTGAEYLVINFTCTWEKYTDRNYINPDWSDQTLTGRKGTFTAGIGKLGFKFKIGDKSWDGNKWLTGDHIFYVETEWDVKAKNWTGPDCWNKDLTVLNNVSWEEELNVSGYKIPLSGVNLTDNIEFEIINPSKCVYGNTKSPKFEDYANEYNAYMWVKNLSFDLVRKEHEDKEENDVVYSNVIDSGSINEMQTITCKITTDTDLIQPSYSNVAIFDGVSTVALSSVTENCISGQEQKPEENIVEKYVLQYNTPTSKITLTQPIDITPMQMLLAVDVASTEQKYVQLGTELDYSMGRQTITAVEKK